jgi:histidine ammonia-lyase
MLRTIESIHALISGSGILTSHRCCPRVQDAYSLRCVPQVHGAVRDALAYVRTTLERELVSVTDNPLLLSDGSVVSGGNFHGEPVAFAADHLKVAMSELACISERRTERLLNPDLSGLPAFLSPDPGTNSGYMIAQYTAASLVSENRVLAHPASVDSIPVSGSQEDHVSMGTIAARHAAMITGNTLHVIATELVCAAQAYEFIDQGEHGLGTGSAYRTVRELVPPLGRDRQFSGDIRRVAEAVLGKRFRRETLLPGQGS